MLGWRVLGFEVGEDVMLESMESSGWRWDARSLRDLGACCAPAPCAVCTALRHFTTSDPARLGPYPVPVQSWSVGPAEGPAIAHLSHSAAQSVQQNPERASWPCRSMGTPGHVSTKTKPEHGGPSRADVSRGAPCCTMLA